MKRASLLFLFVALFAVAQTRPRRTFAVLPQLGSPATVRISQSGPLQIAFFNRSGKHIAACRVGWVAEGLKPAMGEWLRMPPAGLSPGSQFRVSLEPLLGTHPPRSGEVALFVASVRYTDGTSWNADMRQVQNEAAKLLRKKTVVT